VGLRKNGAQEEEPMLLDQNRFERGNPAAIAMMMASVLASVGCDGAESPFAPDFGAEEPPQLSVSAEPPSLEEPPAAATDIPSSPGDEAADSPATPLDDQAESSPRILTVSIRPLIMIDGVTQPDDFPLSDVRRMDIHHVDIVKGAVAMRLYGPRARGGAVEIWTTQGN